ncbi:MAG: hypothetical protein ACYTF0_06950 [Planctomycetota bacterium]
MTHRAKPAIHLDRPHDPVDLAHRVAHAHDHTGAHLRHSAESSATTWLLVAAILAPFAILALMLIEAGQG